MMLSAPHQTVIATADPEAAIRHLAVVDLVERTRTEVDAAVASVLYGTEGPVTEIVLGPSDSRVVRGLVRLVTGASAGQRTHPHTPGPLAVDVYTRDLTRSLEQAVDAGFDTGTRGRLEAGPLVMHQCEVVAPDGWRLVLVEANHRRASLLDTDEHRLHSEVHSVLWTVPSVEDAAAPFLVNGLEQTHLFPFDDPELAAILGIAEHEAKLRMNLLVDDVGHPIRLEFVEFPDAASHPGPDAAELPSGVHGVMFDVEDVAAAGAALAGGEELVTVQHDGHVRAVVETPAGVRVHLRGR